MTTPSALWPKSEGGGREYDERLNGNETPGFNLESDCLRSVPRCLAWLRAARCEKPFCYVSVRQHMCAPAYSVYTMGWDPRGWVGGGLPCEGDPWGESGGGRGHLLAGSGKTRVTAIHLSENTLTQDSICPPPLGSLRPRGPCDPHCLPVDWASCPTSPGSAETATVHLWPGAILGNCNTVQYIEGFRSRRLQFLLGFSSFFFFLK